MRPGFFTAYSAVCELLLQTMRSHLLLIGVAAAGLCMGAQEVLSPLGSKDTPSQQHRIASDVKPPKLKSAPDPKYSAEARAKGLNGTTVLWAIITPDGTVGEVKVQKS